MPAGRYALFGDIVHANGIGETVTAQIDLPEIHGGALAGRRCRGCGPLGVKADYNPVVSELPEGIGWSGSAAGARSMRAGRTCSASAWRMRAGRAPSDMELYMGMLGHAAFVATDGSVFAHVHPSGSVPMAALGIGAVATNPHAEHMMMAGRAARRGVLPLRVSQARHYRSSYR